jgi:hypothetical protein
MNRRASFTFHYGTIKARQSQESHDLPGNHKLQTNHNSKITNNKQNRCPTGLSYNASGDELKTTPLKAVQPFLICDFGHCNLEFVCILYFVFCNFSLFHYGTIKTFKVTSKEMV